MSVSDLPPNQKCAKDSHPLSRGWLLALLLAGIPAAWLAGAEALLIRSKATAPVVSIAEDGTVRLRGRVLRLGADGLPPVALAELEGGPPVELPASREKSVPGCIDFCIYTLVTRTWHYPRLGLTLQIRRYPYGDGTGRASYGGWLKFGPDHPGTVELRGQRLWLGQSTLFNPGLRKEDLIPLWREEDTPIYMDESVLYLGGTLVNGIRNGATHVGIQYAYNYDYEPSWWEERLYDLGINLNPGNSNPLLQETSIGLPSPDDFDSAVWPAEYVVDTVELMPGHEMPDFMKRGIRKTGGE